MEGRITALIDSNVYINNIPISITDFTEIKRKTTVGRVLAKIAGSYIALEGLVIVAFGASMLGDTSGPYSYSSSDAFIVILTGTALTSLGLIPYISNPVKFDLKKKWTMKMVR